MDVVGVLALGFVGLLVLVGGLAIFAGTLLLVSGGSAAHGATFMAAGAVGVALAFVLGRFARRRLHRP